MALRIALLGDSIFDNKAYTGGEPDVIAHLRAILPAPWRASSYAADGSTTTDLTAQLAKVLPDASHLVISIGGNDALGNSDLLHTPVRSTAEALHLFADRLARFEAHYRQAIDRALLLDVPTTVCTIYEGWLEPAEARIARVALMTFNDVILRTAFFRNVSIVDLRFVCTEAADYVNRIEPSAAGGRKIAAAIAQACGALGSTTPAQVHVAAGQLRPS